MEGTVTISLNDYDYLKKEKRDFNTLKNLLSNISKPDKFFDIFKPEHISEIKRIVYD